MGRFERLAEGLNRLRKNSCIRVNAAKIDPQGPCRLLSLYGTTKVVPFQSSEFSASCKARTHFAGLMHGLKSIPFEGTHFALPPGHCESDGIALQ
jgi:hypothetical protein